MPHFHISQLCIMGVGAGAASTRTERQVLGTSMLTAELPCRVAVTYEVGVRA